VHRQVPQAQPPAPPAPSGVDYLGLVLAAHDAETLGQLAFRDLPIQLSEHDDYHLEVHATADDNGQPPDR
jgi:hypothetical protein